MNEQPPAPRVRNGAACPSCGRYVGPVSGCPYCGAETDGRGPLRMLRAAALVLAAAGLVFLYLMARRRDASAVEIGAVTPLMNYATVRVAGTVTRDPYLSRRDGEVEYVSFLVDDGTGAIRVSADGELAGVLVAQNSIPRRGQRVDVTGRLSARAQDRPRLRLQSPAGIRGQERGGKGRAPEDGTP